ncbi:hypothetical protein [Roseateles sp.]|uniref:hypothetical protein n=1 Tax=Roseateles sp. TaxID=1971397 RepID=UPI0032676528
MKPTLPATVVLTFIVGAAAGAGLAVWAMPGGMPMVEAPTLPVAPLAVAAAQPMRVERAAPQVASAATATQCPAAPLPPACPSTVVPPSRPAVAAPVVVGAVPVQLSTEHAAVLMPSGVDNRAPSLQELHTQLLSESVNAQWAPDVEQAIRQAIAAGNGTGEFDVPTVSCRQTLCEVLAFGNLPGSGEKWGELWSGFSKLPWHGQFSGTSTSTFVRNNRHVIVTILRRKPGQPG